MRPTAALLLAGLLLPAAPGPLGAEGDPAAGARKAIERCAGCHVIGARNKYGGIDSTPSFYIMAEKPERYRERVLSVTGRRPHIALEMDLNTVDLDDILAYILTLERPKQEQSRN